ncbi:MAG: hypothetical protein NVSMB27_03070 [Ktedonobacteraceae bacterium]
MRKVTVVFPAALSPTVPRMIGGVNVANGIAMSFSQTDASLLFWCYPGCVLNIMIPVIIHKNKPQFSMLSIG